jgi:hypothetical protein
MMVELMIIGGLGAVTTISGIANLSLLGDRYFSTKKVERLNSELEESQQASRHWREQYEHAVHGPNGHNPQIPSPIYATAGAMAKSHYSPPPEHVSNLVKEHHFTKALGGEAPVYVGLDCDDNLVMVTNGGDGVYEGNTWSAVFFEDGDVQSLVDTLMDADLKRKGH